MPTRRSTRQKRKRENDSPSTGPLRIRVKYSPSSDNKDEYMPSTLDDESTTSSTGDDEDLFIPPGEDEPMAGDEQLITSIDLLQIIDDISKEDKYQIFHEPVDPDQVPGYYDVIQSPIDLSTIRQRVYDNIYNTFGQFFADIQLMFTNAKTFNMEGSPIYVETCRLEKVAKNKASFFDLNARITISETKPRRRGRPKKSISTKIKIPAPQRPGRPKKSSSTRKSTTRTTAPKPRPTPTTTTPYVPPPAPTHYVSPIEQAKYNQTFLRIIDDLKQQDTKRHFITRLDSSYTEYWENVKRPIDLSILTENVQNSVYNSPEHFCSDLYLIFQNVKDTTHPNTGIYRHAKRLLIRAQSLMFEHYNIPTDSMVRDQERAERRLKLRKQEKYTPKIERFTSFPEHLITEERLVEIMKAMIQRLREEDTYRIFLDLPDQNDYPDYYEDITHPMCYNEMERMIDQQEIKSWSDLDYYAELCFANCRHHNPKETIFYREALRHQRVLRKTRDRMIKVLHQNANTSVTDLVPAKKPKDNRRTDSMRKEISKKRHKLPNMLEKLANDAMDYASRLDRTTFFLRPIDRSQYPEFYANVDRPISMDQIKNSIRHNAYATYAEFRQDLETLYRNVITHFPKENVHHKEAEYILGFVREHLDEDEELVQFSANYPEAPRQQPRIVEEETQRSKRKKDPPKYKRSTRTSRAAALDYMEMQEEEHEVKEEADRAEEIMDAVLSAVNQYNTPARSHLDRYTFSDVRRIFNGPLVPQTTMVTKSYTATIGELSDAEFESIANQSVQTLFEQCRRLQLETGEIPSDLNQFIEKSKQTKPITPKKEENMEVQEFNVEVKQKLLQLNVDKSMIDDLLKDMQQVSQEEVFWNRRRAPDVEDVMKELSRGHRIDGR